jgi:serine/threonine protein kinase
MRCAACNVESPDGAIICNSCGSPLTSEITTARDQALSAGTVLQGGGYVIEAVLGQGGFGITYKGLDTKLNRYVAVKEFFPQVQGCLRQGTSVAPGGSVTSGEFHEQRSRFLEEGQRLGQFQHPSIVRVFSLFEENNTAYMVMEFLNGKTLLKMLEDSGPIEDQMLIHITEQIAAALSVVHQANVLHRDIKPENIILTTDSRTVLVDFGTAREFAAGKTRKMTTMLTPGYAPLEQYGQHARFGAFSDIYSLGATTYHLLTGQIPIQATDRAAGVELMAPVSLRHGISQDISNAVMWALEMRVENRPQTASEFVQAIKGEGPSLAKANVEVSTCEIVPNPYRTGIDELVTELEALKTEPAPHARPTGSEALETYDARISEIRERLEEVRTSPTIRPDECPCCLRLTLKRVEPQNTLDCPVCCKTHLRMRKLDEKLCCA